MIVQIVYVDGSVREAPLDAWPDLPGEGVDAVTVQTPTGSRSSQAHSLYWLYPEDGSWVVGEGSVRYDPNPLREVVLTEEGMSEREIEFMPDLVLRQVKLGHWRPGEERP